MLQLSDAANTVRFWLSAEWRPLDGNLFSLLSVDASQIYQRRGVGTDAEERSLKIQRALQVHWSAENTNLYNEPHWLNHWTPRTPLVQMCSPELHCVHPILNHFPSPRYLIRIFPPDFIRSNCTFALPIQFSSCAVCHPQNHTQICAEYLHHCMPPPVMIAMHFVGLGFWKIHAWLRASAAASSTVVKYARDRILAEERRRWSDLRHGGHFFAWVRSPLFLCSKLVP